MDFKFENFIFYDNKLWFTDLETNEFYYYDIKKDETTFVCAIAEEKEFEERLFGAIIQYDCFMYLIPFKANCMYKVDLNTRQYKQINFRCFEHESIPQLKFLSSHKYKNKIYMIPVMYPAIVEYNCDTEEMTYYDNWVKDIKKYHLYRDEDTFVRKSILVDKKIYAPLCIGNAVLIFNVESKEVIVNTVGSEKCSFSGICYDGAAFWLSPRRNGPIVKWNEELGIDREFIINTDIKENEYGYNNIVCVGNKILMLPSGKGEIVDIDFKKNIISEYKKDLFLNEGCFECYMEEEILYLFSFQTNQFYIIKKDENEIWHKPIRIPKYYLGTRKRKRLRALFEQDKSRTKQVYENYKESLIDLVEYIQIKKENVYNKKIQMTGKKIYNQLLKFNEKR